MRVGFAGLGAKFACATGVLFLLLFPRVGKGEPENATPSAPSPSVAQQTIRGVHQVLLLDPAPPEIEAELYDYFLLISERAATGEISPWWAAYLYTSYYRDMLRDRPKGEPRRTREELRAHLQAEVDYYFIRKRPDAAPSPFGAWIYEAIPGQ